MDRLRLIDADALKTRPIIWNGKPETVIDLREIQNAPTIDVASLGLIPVEPLAKFLGSYCAAPAFTGFGTKDNRRAWEFFLLTEDWSEKDEAD